ncbi:MAG: 23S rRNA (guanosine(2251)-2'-O)-methyltransferase RlmB [Atribacterota bacterium]|nr:23S rRNA (guanosine(2251)-2'-O)-methyltransferase RlmB [Atribacterota bacterium]
MKNLIYGRQPVLEALRARRRIFERLILRHGVQGEAIDEILEMAQKLQIPVEWQGEESFREMVGEVVHQGVILVATSPGSYSWQAFLERVAGDPRVVVGFVDRVEDPRNLGAIIRTASFVGGPGLVVSKARTAPLHSQTVKASCGGIEFLDLFQVNNFVNVLRTFKEKGFFMVGMEEDVSTSLWDIDVSNVPVGVVVGGEDQGVRKLVRSECDFLVRIPAIGNVSSLNVSVAFGIGVYEVVRQKRGVGNVEKRRNR